MGLIEKVKFASDIDKINHESMHDDIGKESEEILKRWTKPCQICGEIDYEIVVTEISKRQVFSHVICAHCGCGYVMYPLAVRQIEKKRSIDPTVEVIKEEGFGKALRLARMRQGLNQKELAIKLGCDASFVSRLESSERLPSVETLKQLTKVLGISIDQLVSYLDIEESKPNGR